MGYDFKGFLLEFFAETDSHLKHAAINEAHLDFTENPTELIHPTWPAAIHHILGVLDDWYYITEERYYNIAINALSNIIMFRDESRGLNRIGYSGDYAVTTSEGSCDLDSLTNEDIYRAYLDDVPWEDSNDFIEFHSLSEFRSHLGEMLEQSSTSYDDNSGNVYRDSRLLRLLLGVLGGIGKCEIDYIEARKREGIVYQKNQDFPTIGGIDYRMFARRATRPTEVSPLTRNAFPQDLIDLLLTRDHFQTAFRQLLLFSNYDRSAVSTVRGLMSDMRQFPDEETLSNWLHENKGSCPCDPFDLQAYGFSKYDETAGIPVESVETFASWMRGNPRDDDTTVMGTPIYGMGDETPGEMGEMDVTYRARSPQPYGGAYDGHLYADPPYSEYAGDFGAKQGTSDMAVGAMVVGGILAVGAGIGYSLS